jgi:hypothetical protein
LIFHQGEIGEYGVDADWVLPSPRSGLPEEAEITAKPEPAKSVEPMNGWWRWLRDLLGTA